MNAALSFYTIILLYKMGNILVNDNQLNGNFGHDSNLMLNMSDDELFDHCRNNWHAKEVCDSNNFWYTRIKTYLYHDFPYMLLNLGDYQNIYKYLLSNLIDRVTMIVYHHGTQLDQDDYNDWLDNHPDFLQHLA